MRRQSAYFTYPATSFFLNFLPICVPNFCWVMPSHSFESLAHLR